MATQQVPVREVGVRAPGGPLGPLGGLEQLAGGLATAVLALGVLVVVVLTAAASLVGVGLLAVPLVLRGLRAVADRERARLSRWGPEVPAPASAPARLDATAGRELAWTLLHATSGLLLGLFGVLLPILALRDLTFPLWWWALPDGMASGSIGLWVVRDWPGAALIFGMGVAWVVVIVRGSPHLAHLQALPGRRLLAADPGSADLSLRVAQLTATRAAALDAHVTELRRIERSLHDGTQNRIVAVTVLLGAARRVLERDPAGAEALLERAQTAAEQALAELRAVARGILPPVLEDRGLAGAVQGLAAGCAVPCTADVDVPGRCPASVEATAYFVVAEALTNAVRHSGASSVRVLVHRRGDLLHVEVTDDGRGGAHEGPGAVGGGSGLAGVRRRVEALDGRLHLTSPLGGPTTVSVELPCGS